MSPYPFKTAQEHYEARLEKTQRRGGLNHYTFANFPADAVPRVCNAAPHRNEP